MIRFQIAALMISAGCASDPASEPGGTISGPIKGKPFVVADAFALARDHSSEIVLSSSPDQCVPAAQQVQHPGETALLLLLSDDDSTGHPIVPPPPGTYTINTGSPTLATVEGNILDANCLNNADNDALASTGTVVLSGVKNGIFEGTFDVLMDSGDHITGSFVAPTCTETPNPDPICQP